MMASKNFSFVLILPFFISLTKGYGWRQLKLYRLDSFNCSARWNISLFHVSRKEGRGIRNIKISFNRFFLYNFVNFSNRYTTSS